MRSESKHIIQHLTEFSTAVETMSLPEALLNSLELVVTHICERGKMCWPTRSFTSTTVLLSDGAELRRRGTFTPSTTKAKVQYIQQRPPDADATHSRIVFEELRSGWMLP